MSLLSVAPDMVSAASGYLDNLGVALRGANAAAASQTTAVAAPAADEVSAAITALLGTHAQEFHALSAKAAVFHEEFVDLLNRGAAQYVSTEAANAEKTLANSVNPPAQAVLGRPLVGASQGQTAAAANSAETIFSLPIGPLEAYVQSTPTGGDLGIRLNTPFGSATLFSEGVSETLSPDGSSGGFVYHFGNPLLYFGTAERYSLAGFQISYIFNGLALSWPGSPLFGGIIPNVGFSPIYF